MPSGDIRVFWWKAEIWEMVYFDVRPRIFGIFGWGAGLIRLPPLVIQGTSVLFSLSHLPLSLHSIPSIFCSSSMIMPFVKSTLTVTWNLEDVLLLSLFGFWVRLWTPLKHLFGDFNLFLDFEFLYLSQHLRTFLCWFTKVTLALTSDYWIVKILFPCVCSKLNPILALDLQIRINPGFPHLP